MTDEALRAVAHLAMKHKTGARGLRAIMVSILTSQICHWSYKCYYWYGIVFSALCLFLLAGLRGNAYCCYHHEILGNVYAMITAP